jgi:hypothetical protein
MDILEEALAYFKTGLLPQYSPEIRQIEYSVKMASNPVQSQTRYVLNTVWTCTATQTRSDRTSWLTG